MFGWTGSASGYLGRSLLQVVAVAWMLVSLATQAQPVPINGVYTCVDARGRKLTSDRPIADCADREQQVLNPSGTVRAKVGPTLSAYERSLIEAKERAEQEERARVAEGKRRDRALLMRYTDQSAHDAERSESLGQIGVVRKAAVHRAEELMRRRTALLEEMEFYKKDPSKAPLALRREIEEVTQSLAVQGRFIADQDAEIKRTNARFDEELSRLKQLWASQGGTSGKAR